MKPILTILALTLSCNIAFAQSEGQIYRTDANFLSGIKVMYGGVQKKNAWSGGMNTPQFSTADLNKDGKMDLVVFEHNLLNLLGSKSVKTFINHGTAGSPDYIYTPEFEYKFPFMSYYLIMKDYNNDGVQDLFHYGYNGVELCEGYYDANNMLSFKNGRDIRYQPKGKNFTLGVDVAPTDIPAIIDFDHDGDLDIISYSQFGVFIYMFKNMRMEEGLAMDSFKVKLADLCWGKVSQIAEKTHLLGISCDNSDLRPVEDNTDQYKGQYKTTHGNNSLCLFDSDGDGDYDYLDGNASFSDIQFMRNGKVEFNHSVDSFVSQDTTWQANGTKLFMPNFPTAFWLDIDQDNDKDILISPHATDLVENYNCVAYYKNTGTDANPVFSYQTNTYLIDDMLDLGGNTYPFAYDYNKDGLTDLFVGTLGRYQVNTGTLKSRIVYYENTGTATEPVFTLKDDDFLSTGALDLKGGAVAIGDLDNDGLDDLLIGRQDGTIAIFRNQAATQNDQPVWKLWQTELRDVTASIIQLREMATPFIYDMDKDGKKDLIFGNASGYISYYRNVATSPGQLSLSFVTHTLGEAKVQLGPGYDGYSAPFIGKMDNSGIEYLMVGTINGDISRYDGFQSGNLSAPFIRKDSVYSEINFPGRYVTLSIADINADGKYEMFVGNDRGGLFLYRQVWNVDVNEVTKERKKINLFPNPANDRLSITLNGDVLPTNATVKIYNSMGQLVNLRSLYVNNAFVVDVAVLPVGVYLCCIEYNGEKTTSLFTKN